MPHVTVNMWHMEGGEHSLKISALQLLRFGIDSVLNILNTKDDRLNQIMTNMFIEQPRLHQVC